MKTAVLDVGTKVRWTSQSRASRTEKVGTVHAIVEPWQDAKLSLPRDISRHQVKFDTIHASHKRFIIAVPRGGRSDKVDYYCPRVSDLRLVDTGEPEVQIH